MTNELDEIKAILLQNTSQMATLLESQIKLQAAQDRLQASQDRTQQQLDALTREVEVFSRDTRASIEDLVEMATTAIVQSAENSTFIKGLQVENRRILRELRDRRRDAD